MTESSRDSVLVVSAKELGILKHRYQQYHIAIAIIFLLISISSFYTGSTEPSYQHYMIELYYIPVIISAIAFGWRWGLFYALTASLISLVVLYGQTDSIHRWSNYLSIHSMIRSFLFVFIGVTAGYVSQREKRRQQVYQKVTHILETMPNPVLAKDVQVWFEQILTAAENLLQPKTIDTFSIMLLIEEVEKEEGYLRIIAAKGLSDEVIRTTRHPVGRGIIGQVMRTSKPLVCRDFVNIVDTLSMPNPDNKPVSSICIPLISHGKPIGVLNASSFSKTHPFDETDLPLLVILGSAVAMTVEIADLQKGLKAIYLQTIHSLAGAIDMKDKYTFDHSEKVAKYAVALGHRLNLSDTEIEDLYASALLHDIGKIGVPDAILGKSGGLTDQEYEEVRKHATLGMKILQPLEQMRGVSKVILHHQEWYDGTGYPQGLKGEQIPLGSRILAVVDAFHAMTSDRIYRKALPVEIAIEELKRNKGKQFDPTIVDLFLKTFQQEQLMTPVGNSN